MVLYSRKAVREVRFTTINLDLDKNTNIVEEVFNYSQALASEVNNNEEEAAAAVQTQKYSKDTPKNVSLNPKSSNFIFNNLEQDLLNPNIEAPISKLRKYHLGFRQNKVLVNNRGKNSFEADYQRVPVEYLFPSLSRSQVSVSSTIEGPLDKSKLTKLIYQKCQNSKILILIKSAITHFDFRTTIRNSWAKDLSTDPASKINILFTVAKRPSDTIMSEMLDMELREYNDMLIGDFIDSYYNVTKKVVMGMRFVVENCYNVEDIIHIDDDVYVSPSRFETLIKNKNQASSHPQPQDYINCGVPVVKPYAVLRPDNKKHPEWGLSKTAYSTGETPTYCNGPCYSMPIETYRKIFESVIEIDFEKVEKLDDLILTGLVRAGKKIPIYEASGMFCWHLDNKSKGVDKKMMGFYNLGRSRVEKGLEGW